MEPTACARLSVSCMAVLVALLGESKLATAASITVNIINSSVNDLGTPKTITGLMTMDVDTGLASGTVNVDPQALCFPWAAGKAVIWVLKTSKRADSSLSLLDVAGGDLGGTLTMIDAATGTNVTDVFRLTRTSPTNVNGSFQIIANYNPSISLLGDWSSSELISPAGPGSATATGQSIFRRASDGSNLVAPYTVSYQFLGNPGGQLGFPIQASQQVNFATSTFNAQVNAAAVPEPSTFMLSALSAACSVESYTVGASSPPAVKRAGRHEHR